LPDGRLLVASLLPCLGLMSSAGEEIWSVLSPLIDFRGRIDALRVSADGRVVDFALGDASKTWLRFDARNLLLLPNPPDDGLTLASNRQGLEAEDWQNQRVFALNGHEIALDQDALSLALARDGKRVFVGSPFELSALDDAGPSKWRLETRNEVWAVNASRDGGLVVAALGDGTIRWHRADDGRELLALQILPNKTDWVLWTPEGFYEATPGARDALKWVTNHGPDKPTTTLPVSAIVKLHRPNALPHVLDQLETAHALGLEDISEARLDIQAKTGSAKPPGAVLHVLAIGVDNFGDKAGGLHLDYAAEDAHDVASALLENQRITPGKASLYADVKAQYLPNDQANHTAILDALDEMARSMPKGGPDQDVAVILFSSHGEMIGDQFYLIPYDFVANGSQNAAATSAVSASEFAKKVQALAQRGKVLLLLDACHSGAVGAGGWAKDPDAKVLQDAMDMENVTVLSSSRKNELSQELPSWRHGAFTQAFLDALIGAADSHGVIRLSALTDAMEAEVQTLTHGQQHLGMHVNFGGDLFVANH
jgi:hypothetical protein